MNKTGQSIILRFGDIEKLFDAYVDGGHDTDEYRDIKIEIFADEFGRRSE